MQAALGAVIVDFQITVLGVTGQGFPVRQRASNGLSFGTLRQNLGLLSLQARLDVVQDGYRLGLTQRQPSLTVKLHVAGFPLHAVQQPDMRQHDRRAHQVGRLRFVELAPRMRPASDFDHVTPAIAPNRMATILYGAAHYREYMPYERLEQGVKLMERADISVVRVGDNITLEA